MSRILTGTYLQPDGSPVKGRVTFTPAVRVKSSTSFIVASPSTVRLDSSGSFEIELECTDDESTLPAGWTWKVVEKFEGGSTFYIELPSGEGSVSIADLAQLSTAPSVSYVGPPGEPGPPGATGVIAATSPITYDEPTKTVGINQAAIAIAAAQVSGLGTMATQSAAAYAALAAANTFTNEQKIQNGGLSLIVGADSSAATLTNSAAKYARLGVPHYTTGEEPLALITGISESGSNELRVGGGTSLMNAATAITLYTANGGAITTGTPRLTIGPTGVITSYGQTVVDGSADAVQLRIQGHSSQTANLQEWQDSSGAALAYVAANGAWRTSGTFGSTAAGKAYLQPNGTSGELLVGTNAAANKGLVVQGAAAQTANLFEAQNSSGTALAAISAAGAATFNGVTSVGRVAAQASGGASGMNGASIIMGADDGLTSLTNDTAKNGMICVPHYTNAEEPVGLLRGSSDGTTNSIWIGGGPSNVNGATVIRFFTAASAASTTVTEHLRLDTNGVTAYQTIIGAASTTSAATLRVPHGTAPSAPVDGDVWTTTTGAYIRVNGVTKQIQFV